MVNINAIESILKFVNEKKIKPMKKWSDRAYNKTSSRLSKLIRSSRTLMDLLSGNNTISMLKSKFKSLKKIRLSKIIVSYQTRTRIISS
jgi:hypothetical protein